MCYRLSQTIIVLFYENCLVMCHVRVCKRLANKKDTHVWYYVQLLT